MSEVVTTLPVDAPISAAEAKEHARITTTVDDAYIAGLIAAATEFAQDYTNRAFFTQTITRYLDHFPRCGDRTIRVDRQPMASVSAIRYVDTNGVQQTLSVSVYRVDTAAGRIAEAYNQTWPDTRSVINAVEVDYVAGTAKGSIPDTIVQAIKLIVEAEYNGADEYPQTVYRLLDSQRRYVL